MLHLKIRANHFSPDEFALLVDLVQENKQKPLGALTVKRKYNVWTHSTAFNRGLRNGENQRLRS